MRVMARAQEVHGESGDHEVTLKVTLHEVDVDEEGFHPGTYLGHNTVRFTFPMVHVNALQGLDFPAGRPTVLYSHASEPYRLDEVAVQTWCLQDTWVYAIEPVTFRCHEVYDITFRNERAIVHIVAPPCTVTLQHHPMHAVDTTTVRQTLSCPDVMVPLTSSHQVPPECLLHAVQRYAEQRDITAWSDDIYPDTTPLQRVLLAIQDHERDKNQSREEVEIYY